MTTRRSLYPAHFLTLALAVALLFAVPSGAAAATTDGGGTGIEVAFPGLVSLLADLGAGLVLLGLAVARRRPTG